MSPAHRWTVRSLAIAGLVWVVATRPGAAQQMTISLGDALSYYELGEIDAVARALADSGGGDAEHFMPVFKKDAAAWIAADGPAAVPRRRLVAATFALEIGYSGLSSQFEMTKQATEWACDLLRSAGPPSEVERKWQLAALALLEGSFEPGDPRRKQEIAPALTKHLGHLKARFPEEPRIELVRAYLHEYDYWTVRLKPSSVRGMLRTFYDESAAALAIPSLESLTQRPGIGPEVHLRLGYLEYARDHLDAALEHLAAASRGSDDPTRAYLAHLFIGWTHEKAKRFDDATASFRRALASVNALSAALALGVRLYGVNSRDEADAVVQSALDAGVSTPDPWKEYGYGDLRRFPQLIAELRQMIRQ